MRVLQLPSNTTIPGPQQVQNNFESDARVASQLSLLRQGGSEVELGNLLSLPFNGGLLYVEPVFIRAAQDGFPLFRKVLVGYGSNVVMEDTLEEALAQVFDADPNATVEPEPLPDGTDGTDPGTTPSPTPTPTPDPTAPTDPATALALALARAQEAYDDGQRALAQGDFAAYGEAQERLKDALDDAAAAEAALFPELVPESTPTPTPEDTSGASA
jgi:uncharacterized membrane protein (UPF0182 family)